MTWAASRACDQLAAFKTACGPPQLRAGYLSGCYWRAYALTGDPKWARLAAAELPGLEEVAEERDVSAACCVQLHAVCALLPAARPPLYLSLVCVLADLLQPTHCALRAADP